MFRNVVSSVIRQQVPEYIRENHPVFVDFLEAYYEWCESQDGSVGSIASYQELMDAGLTTDAFFDEFHKMYMPSLPRDFLADRGLVIKNIKDFYAAKGTEKAIRFLFRILYDEEISFYYPKTDILCASDGTWRNTAKIFVTSDTGDIFALVNQTITGVTSGAVAGVIDITEVPDTDPQVYELSLIDYDGSFTVGESVEEYYDGEITTTALGYVSSITITNAGDSYEVGDPVVISSPTGTGATVVVSKISGTNPITGFEIIDGGSGYRVGDKIDLAFLGGSGIGGVATVASVTPDSVETVYTTLISSIQNTVISTISASTIISLLSSTTVTRGAITGITLSSAGKYYPNRFLVRVNQQTPTYGYPAGTGAVIYADASNTGKVLECEVSDSGYGYLQSNTTGSLTGQGDGTARVSVNVSAGPLITGGQHIDDNGKLSDRKYLQDNVFYQQYSYVVKSTQELSNYKDILKKTTHPSGFILFGELNLESSASCPSSVNSASFIELELTQNISVRGFATTYQEVTVDYTGTAEYEGIVLDPATIADYASDIVDDYDGDTISNWAGFGGDLIYNQPSSHVDTEVVP